MKFPESAFWDFSISLYPKPGIGDACLVLQDRHEIDVNILLFCLWLANDGHPPATEKDMRIYAEAVRPWHEMAVRRLRAIRKWMKTPKPPVDESLAQSVRAAIQKTEIDAEHLEQITLHNCVRTQSVKVDDPTRLSRAASNLRHYFELARVDLNTSDEKALTHIFHTAFPGATNDEVAAAVTNIHVE